jgi:Tol biopolymer transport system component
VEAGESFWPALSPDGRRIAIDRIDAGAGTRDIWVLDDVRGGASRLTFHPGDDSDAVWSPDGRRIAFGHETGRALHEINLDAAGGARALLQFGRDQVYPTDWSADGRIIAYVGFGPTGSADVWLVPLDGVRKPVPFAATRFHEGQARIAPDGRWIAYTSDESGRPEVYIQAMPPAEGRRQVSTGGGAQPMWRRDGRELFYLALDNTLMAVRLGSDTPLDAGTPAPLFKVRIEESLFPAVRNHYAVTSDGQRFLINSVTGSQSLSVVLNWTAGLKP